MLEDRSLDGIQERLLEDTEERQLNSPQLFAMEPVNTANWLVLMTSKDLTTIHQGLSSPVRPFTSPFIGMSVDEVTAWYDANISQTDVVGYFKRTFIVLEQEAVDDEICTIVCTSEKPAGKLRCDFTLALQTVCTVTMEGSTEEGTFGSFKRSGVAMTKDNYELASNRGMYMDGMEVKIDEAWRDFTEVHWPVPPLAWDRVNSGPVHLYITPTVQHAKPDAWE
ncbi:hypothetical protein D9619_006039 [Psilocybe cf. subviscida]|uniref:Uncharacterized protein n=1 Tax=Psilocybe cf. subviscida TaxID=2480587 RepID=A0A8H5BWZ5_9AGAR|nr:hypothetical protein D9619_006039 [Psilocybe cf. subviscida]